MADINLSDFAGDTITLTTAQAAAIALTDVISPPIIVTGEVNGKDGIGVPAGGTTNQVLAKTSSADYATNWKTITNITVSTVAPSSPALNDLWLNTA